MRGIKRNTKRRTTIKRNTKKSTTTKRNKRNTKKRGVKKRGGTKRKHIEVYADDDDENVGDEINVVVELRNRIDTIEINSLPSLRSYPAETVDDIIDILNYDGEAQIFEYDGQEQDYKALLHKKLLQELLELYNKQIAITNGQAEFENNEKEKKQKMLEIVELLEECGYVFDDKLRTAITPKPVNLGDWDNMFGASS